MFDNDIFDGSNETSYVDTFVKEDNAVQKEKIKEWIDTHCVFVDSLNNAEENKTNSPDGEGTDYEIDDNGFINVKKYINVRADENFPSYIRFGTIGEDFYMMGQRLTATDGFPKEILGSLWLFDNMIDTITDFPTHVGGQCCLRKNRLKSLANIPTEVGGVLDVADNDPDFKYTRNDDKIINVGLGFYGCLPPGADVKYKTTEKVYQDMAGDENDKSFALAKMIVDEHIPVRQAEGKKKWVYESHGDV